METYRADYNAVDNVQYQDIIGVRKEVGIFRVLR